MAVFKLHSDNQFIRTSKGFQGLHVHDYMDDPNVFEMIHASDSRWRSPSTAVGPSAAATFKALEVFGVIIGGDRLKELVKDLTLTDPYGQTFHLVVNRQGLCFLYVASQPIMRLRINDHFGWSKYRVKPRIETIWSVWDMSNGAVLVAPPSDGVREGDDDGSEKYYGVWKKILEEKDKVMEEKAKVMEERESLLRKSLAEKEREVVALKAVVKALSSSDE